jgi:hypothetical protein
MDSKILDDKDNGRLDYLSKILVRDGILDDYSGRILCNLRIDEQLGVSG